MLIIYLECTLAGQRICDSQIDVYNYMILLLLLYCTLYLYYKCIKNKDILLNACKIFTSDSLILRLRKVYEAGMWYLMVCDGI